MLLIRYLLIGLASLNSAWALAHFLEDYLRFVIQNLDPLGHYTPFDPASLIAWLAVALVSGLGAFVNFRVSSKKQRRDAKILVAPAPTRPTEQTPDLAA
jgi:hypothetical protein